MTFRIKPDWARGYQRKGTALFYLNKLDDAIETYKEGLKHDPDNAALKEDLKSAEKKKSPPEPAFNPAHLQKLMTLMNHPEIKELMGEPGFMQKVQMLMTNPQMAPILIEQDPNLKKAYEILNSTAETESFNFEEMMKNMGGAGGFNPKPDFEEEKPSPPEPKK